MILLLHTPAFDHVLDEIKRIVADDQDLPAVNLWTINAVVYDLFRNATERVNILDIDPEYRVVYQPFYEALNELLLQNDIPLMSVSNLLVDGPDRWMVVLILGTSRGTGYGL